MPKCRNGLNRQLAPGPHLGPCDYVLHDHNLTPNVHRISRLRDFQCQVPDFLSQGLPKCRIPNFWNVWPQPHSKYMLLLGLWGFQHQSVSFLSFGWPKSQYLKCKNPWLLSLPNDASRFATSGLPMWSVPILCLWDHRNVESRYLDTKCDRSPTSLYVTFCDFGVFIAKSPDSLSLGLLKFWILICRNPEILSSWPNTIPHYAFRNSHFGTLWVPVQEFLALSYSRYEKYRSTKILKLRSYSSWAISMPQRLC